MSRYWPMGSLTGKIFRREAFINHSHGGRVLIVCGGEKSSAFQWNLHHPQIVWLHDIKDCHGQIALVGRLGPVNVPEIFFIIAAHGCGAPIE